MTTLQDLRRRISLFLDERRKRRQLRQELVQLEAMGSLDTVLADIGLCRAQIDRVIAGSAGSAELLDRMLVRLGINARQLPMESLRDMTWTCTVCSHKHQCREWLSGADATGFRSFCPNAAELDYALSKQPRVGA